MSSREPLIIDEISILSKRLFEQIEVVCRLSKQSPCPFWGMQLIPVEDFK